MATIEVKVMRSYDYNHFEIRLSADIGDASSVSDFTKHADALRKEAARLADKAVLQYRQRKSFEINKAPHSRARDRIADLQQEIDQEIKERMLPQFEYDPELKAKIKLVADMRFALSREFDYDDDDFYSSVRDLFQIDADSSGE